MKGVILAGGLGTRLRPATNVTNKHLIPILNKPMILYPMATLRTFGIKEVLIVSGGDHIGDFAEFLGDGSQYDLDLTYKVQKSAGGIAEALGLAEAFVAGEDVLVILGDNIFDNRQFISQEFYEDMAHLYVKKVKDPQRFGVIEIKRDYIKSIEEKPKIPKSDLAVTGLYHYPNDVFKIIRTLEPSDRGELEITDVNNAYLKEERLKWFEVKEFWSDAGTPKSLFEAINWAYNDTHTQPLKYA